MVMSFHSGDRVEMLHSPCRGVVFKVEPCDNGVAHYTVVWCNRDDVVGEYGYLPKELRLLYPSPAEAGPW